MLLCPAAADPGIRHGERSWQVEGKTVKYLDAWSYTEWFNLLGTPAAGVPVGKSPEGLPIGVQISGRPWEEEIVLCGSRCFGRAMWRMAATADLVEIACQELNDLKFV